MVADRQDQRLDLGVEPGNMILDTLAYRLARHCKPVAFLLAHRLQGIQAQHQRAQRLLGRRWRLPGLWLALMGEVGDQLCIDLVGLGAHQARSAEGLDLGRIDDTDHHAKSSEIFGNPFPIRARRFHAHPGAAGSVLQQPCVERDESLVVVLDHLVTMLALG